jgi:hypothetical protein
MVNGKQLTVSMTWRQATWTQRLLMDLSNG